MEASRENANMKFDVFVANQGKEMAEESDTDEGTDEDSEAFINNATLFTDGTQHSSWGRLWRWLRKSKNWFSGVQKEAPREQLATAISNEPCGTITSGILP